MYPRVFQVVLGVTLGSGVPKPARPVPQAESSKLVAYQFEAGVLAVYFQVWGTTCEVGTTVVTMVWPVMAFRFEV